MENVELLGSVNIPSEFSALIDDLKITPIRDKPLDYVRCLVDADVPVSKKT